MTAGMKSISEMFAPRTFWKTMIYRCDTCDLELEFFLEEGCEGPREVEYDIIIQSGPQNGEPSTWWKTKGGRKIVPVPFVAGGCPKCQGKPPWNRGTGVLQHADWNRDRLVTQVGLPPGTARFHYPNDAARNMQACGIPIYPPHLMRGAV